jgi:tRNA(Ile)-lysidine synthetase-like protein
MIYLPEPSLKAQAVSDFELQFELGLRGKKDLGEASLRWHVEHRRGAWTVSNATVSGLLECFDADKLGERIILRHWRPGDRFQPIGMAKSVKLQDLLTNAKIPRKQRHTLVLATTSRGDIFWVESLRISEQFKLTPATLRRLVWQWKRP